MDQRGNEIVVLYSATPRLSLRLVSYLALVGTSFRGRKIGPLFAMDPKGFLPNTHRIPAHEEEPLWRPPLASFGICICAGISRLLLGDRRFGCGHFVCRAKGVPRRCRSQDDYNTDHQGGFAISFRHDHSPRIKHSFQGVFGIMAILLTWSICGLVAGHPDSMPDTRDRLLNR